MSHVKRKPSSRTSAGSVASVGMGTERPPNSAQVRQLDAKYISLRAHNASQERTKATFDCVVYILFCPTHDKIAVTQVDNDVYWFPFVCREGRTWKAAMQEGLQSLLETRDADGSVVRSMKLDASHYTLEMFRLQSVDLKWSQRMTQFVSIQVCNKTCEPNNNLIWLSATELMAKCDAVFWGPECRKHLTRFREHGDKVHQLEVVEQTTESVIQNICSSNSLDHLGMLFQSCNLGADQLCELYEAYLWHVYPANCMSLPSFRVFLRKNDFSCKSSGCKTTDEDQLTEAIFRACQQRSKRTSKGDYIDFIDLAYAIVAMDPKTPTEKPRIRFLFSLYDRNKSGTLTGSEVERLTADSGAAKLPSKMVPADLQKAIESKQMPLIEQVCRLPQSVFIKIAEAKKAATEVSTSSKVAATSKVKSKRTRFVCPTCRVKKFDYCKHCVTIDSMGRCVEPKIIINSDNPTMRTDLKGQMRHSMECAFNASSIGNIFFDHIRARRLLALDKDIEQQDFYERFKNLCEQVAMFVKLEPKIVKRQSPAVIIGDLNGHMESLLTLETAFWHSVPVIGDNIIFLGNYTGNSSRGQSIELLAYIFAIKYLCPNKVVLLRGVQETKAFNEKTLLVECRSRLGNEMGTQVWNMINDIFQHLPIVAVVNEATICTPSGIPKDTGKQRLSNMFENMAKDNVLFQQMATNMPDRDTEQSRSKEQLFKPVALVPNAYTFSHQAFKDFMQRNQYVYMIRSNEELAKGFNVCFSRRLITIASNLGADGEAPSRVVVAMVTHPRGRIQLAEIDHHQ